MQKEKQLKSCCKNSLSSREVVARDLPHPMPLFNEKKQPCFTRDVEDPRTLRTARCTPPTSGMTGLFYHGNNGFTLIELLVVILIIGILAAVALPQYQKAVHKSRIAAMLPLMRSIKNAQESYYLANGEYARFFDDLEVSLPAGCQIYHTYGNMFYCQDWLVDNEINDVVTGRLKLSYCPNVPEKSADYRLCNTYALMWLTLYYDYADVISKRGTLSCTASEAGLCAAFN